MSQRYRSSEALVLESPKSPRCSIGESKRIMPHSGIIMAIGSSFFFSLSSLIVKLVPDIHPVALAAYRFAGILLPSIPIVIYNEQDPFPKGKRLLLLLRGFLGTTSLMSQFYALRHMPLADASVIIFSVPVFVAIFARIFLKVCFFPLSYCRRSQRFLSIHIYLYHSFGFFLSRKILLKIKDFNEFSKNSGFLKID